MRTGALFLFCLLSLWKYDFQCPGPSHVWLGFLICDLFILLLFEMVVFLLNSFSEFIADIRNINCCFHVDYVWEYYSNCFLVPSASCQTFEFATLGYHAISTSFLPILNPFLPFEFYNCCVQCVLSVYTALLCSVLNVYCRSTHPRSVPDDRCKFPVINHYVSY